MSEINVLLSSRARDCNAQFSEIFQEGVFGELNLTEKSLFITLNCSNSFDYSEINQNLSTSKNKCANDDDEVHFDINLSTVEITCSDSFTEHNYCKVTKISENVGLNEHDYSKGTKRYRDTDNFDSTKNVFSKRNKSKFGSANVIRHENLEILATEFPDRGKTITRWA